QPPSPAHAETCALPKLTRPTLRDSFPPTRPADCCAIDYPGRGLFPGEQRPRNAPSKLARIFSGTIPILRQVPTCERLRWPMGAVEERKLPSLPYPFPSLYAARVGSSYERSRSHRNLTPNSLSLTQTTSQLVRMFDRISPSVCRASWM